MLPWPRFNVLMPRPRGYCRSLASVSMLWTRLRLGLSFLLLCLNSRHDLYFIYLYKRSTVSVLSNLPFIFVDQLMLF